MIYKATINVFVDVEDEYEACDAIAETLREILQKNDTTSSLIDWYYHASNLFPCPATKEEIEGLEQP